MTCATMTHPKGPLACVNPGDLSHRTTLPALPVIFQSHLQPTLSRSDAYWQTSTAGSRVTVSENEGAK